MDVFLSSALAEDKKKLHLYENHLGGYYTSPVYDEQLEARCSRCGDNDWYVGQYTKEAAKAIMETNGTTEEHIKEVLMAYEV